MKLVRRIFLVSLLAVLLSSVSLVALAYERAETLVYGGGLWAAPSNWNPLTPWAEVTGTGGLVYETLFHYYPLTAEYQPWLAKSGKWVSDTVYEIELRKGIKWTDGQDFTADDVKFTFEIAKTNQLHYSNVWEWIKEIKVLNPYQLQFVFSKPHYQEWKLLLYDLRIIPKHIWSKVPADNLLTTANKEPIGTGPYMVDSVAQDRMVWVRNEKWWGNEVFGKPKPKYLVNLVVYENNVALGMLMKRELDLSNYFIPGVPKIKDTFGLTTWFKKRPYMLSENVALLFLNSTKEGLKDAKFRRALAFAINPAMITERVFEDQVEVADPTGLFGKGWMEYHSKEAVKEYGFSYNPQKAKELLDVAGYVDANKDGWRDLPNGKAMKFEIIVPNGWTDWMESIKIIAENLRAVGINVVPSFPDFSIYFDRLQRCTFDMAINNFGSAWSASPFTYSDLCHNVS